MEEIIKHGYQPLPCYDKDGNLIEFEPIPPTGGTSEQDE